MIHSSQVSGTAVCLTLLCSFTCSADEQVQPDAPAAVSGIIPSGFGEAVDRDVARVRAATAPFRAVDAALAAGYLAANQCIAHPTHGVMGFHYKKPALRDATIDVEQPEILLYERMPDGTFRLNGVEYVVPLSAWKSDDPPRVMNQAMLREENLKIWYLHVWLWEPNPSGIFSDWNPQVKC